MTSDGGNALQASQQMRVYRLKIFDSLGVEKKRESSALIERSNEVNSE